MQITFEYRYHSPGNTKWKSILQLASMMIKMFSNLIAVDMETKMCDIWFYQPELG